MGAGARGVVPMLLARTSKAPFTTNCLRLVDLILDLHRSLGGWNDHELCNPVSTLTRESTVATIFQDHDELSTVV